MNSVVTGQFLVFFSFITDVAFLRTDVVESVVEVLVCIEGVIILVVYSEMRSSP